MNCVKLVYTESVELAVKAYEILARLGKRAIRELINKYVFKLAAVEIDTYSPRPLSS